MDKTEEKPGCLSIVFDLVTMIVLFGVFIPISQIVIVFSFLYWKAVSVGTEKPIVFAIQETIKIFQ